MGDSSMKVLMTTVILVFLLTVTCVLLLIKFIAPMDHALKIAILVVSIPSTYMSFSLFFGIISLIDFLPKSKFLKSMILSILFCLVSSVFWYYSHHPPLEVGGKLFLLKLNLAWLLLVTTTILLLAPKHPHFHNGR